MEKIALGIQHIVVLKNLDKFHTTYSKVYLASHGGYDYSLDYNPAVLKWGTKSGAWVSDPYSLPYDPTALVWTEDTSVSPSVWKSGNYTLTYNPAWFTWSAISDAYQSNYKVLTITTNPTSLTWTESVTATEGDQRQYKCELKCVDTGTMVSAAWDATHVKTLVEKTTDGETYYVAFIFSSTETALLDVGKVDMTVYDENNEIIYYKHNYAKVLKLI